MVIFFQQQRKDIYSSLIDSFEEYRYIHNGWLVS